MSAVAVDFFANVMTSSVREEAPVASVGNNFARCVIDLETKDR